MRKNSRELPDKTELAKILAHEAKRKLPPGKINLHYPDFSSVIKIFAAQKTWNKQLLKLWA